MARRVVSVSVVQVLSHMIASVCVIFKTFLNIILSFEGINIIYKQDLSFSGKVLSDMRSGSYGDKLIKKIGHNEFLKSDLRLILYRKVRANRWINYKKEAAHIKYSLILGL